MITLEKQKNKNQNTSKQMIKGWKISHLFLHWPAKREEEKIRTKNKGNDS